MSWKKEINNYYCSKFNRLKLKWQNVKLKLLDGIKKKEKY